MSDFAEALKGGQTMERLGIRNSILNTSLASGMGNMIQTANAVSTGTSSTPKGGSAAPEASGNAQNRFDRFEKTGKAAQSSQGKGVDEGECKTCSERRYQDGSDDSGVSFQSPTKVSPQAAASAVRSHEQEHVTRNAAKAEREGKIAHSNVAIHTAVCPECGKTYVSGGTTTTTFSDDPKKDENGKSVSKIEGNDNDKGGNKGGFKPVGNPDLLKKFGAGTSRYAA
jgi:hypothetical protein